ncbi:hypothetical protein ARMGADRAFT_1036731 [Armillaria gallica]|uniref:Uncharacterized protein n=1 Tax=Armillaria gallica TaxID=47427 RepID=A0A2H3D7I1_ARMGA|nr:hypothetical protein ARMGADRAFT_1036731 [Armillaria gallica]
MVFSAGLRNRLKTYLWVAAARFTCNRSPSATSAMGLGKVLVKCWKRWFRKNKDDIRVCDEDEETIQAKSLPKVTLASIAENAQQDSSIPALNRQSSAGGTPIMPSGPADVPCAGLGIDSMLEEIDDSETLGISHKLEEEQRNRENRLPEVILSVVAENGGQDSSIPALMQQSSASAPSGLVDLPFADLGIDTTLKECNDSATPDISHNLEYEQVRTSKPTEEDNE